MSETPDLLAAPPEEAGLAVGTIEGPPGWQEGFGAGLRVWCGAGGWRPFGEVITQVGCVVFHRGRLSIGISWDLGPHTNPRLQRKPDTATDEDQDDG